MKLTSTAQTFIGSNHDKLPEKSLPLLRQRMACLDESQQFALVSMSLKIPLYTFLFSFFFGYLGLDRFYVGHVGIGCFKLFMSSISVLLGFIAAGLFIGKFFIGAVIITLFLVGYVIWLNLEMFFSFRITRQANLDKVNEMMYLTYFGDRS